MLGDRARRDRGATGSGTQPGNKKTPLVVKDDQRGRNREEADVIDGEKMVCGTVNYGLSYQQSRQCPRF